MADDKLISDLLALAPHEMVGSDLLAVHQNAFTQAKKQTVDEFKNVIDARTRGVLADWNGSAGTDDTTAWQQVIADANAVFTGSGGAQRATIIMPRGISLISSGLDPLTSPANVIGHGPRNSGFQLANGFSGQVLTLRDWTMSPTQTYSDVAPLTSDTSAAVMYGFGIYGDLGAAGTQHGLVTESRMDQLLVHSVFADRLNGHGFWIGKRSGSYGEIRESLFTNCDVRFCGSASHAGFLIGDDTTTDGTNQVVITNSRFRHPNNGASIFHAHGNQSGTSNQPMRKLNLSNCMFHGPHQTQTGTWPSLCVVEGDIGLFDWQQCRWSAAKGSEYFLEVRSNANGSPSKCRFQGNMQTGANGVWAHNTAGGGSLNDNTYDIFMDNLTGTEYNLNGGGGHTFIPGTSQAVNEGGNVVNQVVVRPDQVGATAEFILPDGSSFTVNTV